MSGEIIYADSDTFGQFNVHEMSESEWALESATPTAIKDPKCHIILFYEPNTTDLALMDTWREIARNVGGPVIAAVNTSARREIMAAFFKVQGDLNDPFNAYTGFRAPAIIVYRSRWPQAFYNGELTYAAIVAWITNLACKPGYRELDAYNDNVVVGPGPAPYYPSQDETYLDGEELPENEMPRDNQPPVNNQQIVYASVPGQAPKQAPRGYSTPATSSPLPDGPDTYDVGFI